MCTTVLLSLLCVPALVSAYQSTSRRDYEQASPHIIGYWGCNPGGHSSTESQLKTSIERGYNVIIFAFYLVDANGGLNQDPGSVPAPLKSSLNGTGQFTYLISLFGGQNGAAPTIGDPAVWARNMFNNFQNLHRSLGLDGIDIDLENAWGGTPDSIVCGLRTFFGLMHGAGFVVSMAPQTTAITPEVPVYQAGSWNSYVPLSDTSIQSNVDAVAVQLYNNGLPLKDPGKYAQALSGGFSVTGCPCGASGQIKLDPKKITFGFPAGPGAAPSGCPDFPGGCPYGRALSTLYNSNPTLLETGGVMTWAVEWDEVFAWQFVSAAKSINFK